MNRKKTLIPLFLFFLFSGVTSASHVHDSKGIGSGIPTTILTERALDYRGLIDTIDINIVDGHLRYFADLGSRVTGTLSCAQAAEYIKERFVKYGLSNVSYHEYDVATLVDYGARFELAYSSEKFEVYGLEPNLVVPVTAPQITAPIVYVGNEDTLDGKEVEGRICLMDFNTGYQWLELAEYGAKAIVFAEPETTTYVEEFEKKIELPFNFPRYYMPREDADILVSMLSNQDDNPPTVKITSRMTWEKAKGINVLGMIQGTEHTDQIILLTSHYDSYSAVPSISPGANDACGVASLLELARFFSNPRYRPEYSIMFVAFSGHYQGLSGSRWFLEDLVRTSSPYFNEEERAMLQLDLHLSSRQDSWLFTGTSLANTFDTYVFDIVDAVQNALGKDYAVSSAVEPGASDRSFPTLGPLDDSSAMRLLGRQEGATAGGAAWSFVTKDQSIYAFWKTAASIFDTYDKLELSNLQKQLETIFPIAYCVAVTKDLSENYLSQYRVGIGTPSFELTGTVATYNRTSMWWQGLPNALIHITRQRFRVEEQQIKSYDYWVVISDENGFFREPNMWNHDYTFWFSKLNSTTGNVIYASDYGVHRFAPRKLSLQRPLQGFLGFCTVFKASTAIIFDTIDPTLIGISGVGRSFQILEHEASAPPESYGVILQDISYQRSLTALFLPPEKPIDIIYKSQHLGDVPLGFLVNASEEYPEGAGYSFIESEQYVFEYTPLLLSEDMYFITSNYVEKLAALGMAKDLPRKLNEVNSLLGKARSAIADNRYVDLEADSMAAWSLLTSAYKEARELITDISNTVVFIGMFLAPFAFVSEKLFLGRTGRRRLIYALTIYITCCVVFFFLHPAFQFSGNPIMSIAGLSSLLLVLPTAFIPFTYVSSSIGRLTRKVRGIQYAEVSKGAAMLLSFSLGIENSKKRKMRSALLFVTMIITVVALALFASLSSITSFQAPIIPRKTDYQGIYLKPLEWAGSLSIKTIDVAQGFYGEIAKVTARSWLYTSAPGNTQKFYTLRHNSNEIRVYAALGMCILDPLSVNLEGTMREGRWFVKPDELSCIITNYQAQALGIEEIPALVNIFGMDFKVVGIVDSDLFDSIMKELYGEGITPWDATRIGEEEVHVSISDSIIIPYEVSLSLGAKIASVSIVLDGADNQAIYDNAEDLFSTFNYLIVYAYFEEGVGTFSKLGGFVVFGWQMQIVPTIIAVLGILNLMVGSVQERKNEIFVYSSVGVSPLHITFMFLAEALIYAIMSSIIGYGITLAIPRILTYLGPTSISLDYSSSWVVTVIGIVIAITTGSAIHPMFMASRLVTPSAERVWTLPSKPKGDEWTIPLPFVFSEENETRGFHVFLKEYLEAFSTDQLMKAESTVFAVKDISYSEEELREDRRCFRLNASVRLPPYEQGIQQEIVVRLMENQQTGKWTPEIKLSRKSGSRTTWARANRDFVDKIRKRFLLWRSLATQEREEYIRGKEGSHAGEINKN